MRTCLNKGEPKPDYVPEGAPWCWSVDGLEDKVALWFDGDSVRVYDPDCPDDPWVFHGEAEKWPCGHHEPHRLTAVLWDDAKALLDSVYSP